MPCTREHHLADYMDQAGHTLSLRVYLDMSKHGMRQKAKIYKYNWKTANKNQATLCGLAKPFPYYAVSSKGSHKYLIWEEKIQSSPELWQRSWRTRRGRRWHCPCRWGRRAGADTENPGAVSVGHGAATLLTRQEGTLEITAWEKRAWEMLI